MLKKLLLATALVGMASSLAAETLKVGIIAPLTGGGAPWGVAGKVGTELAAKAVNDAGGLKVGDETYQIEVVAYDDKYMAADAVAAYNRLVNQDGVKYMIVVTSAGTMALKQDIEDDDVLALTASYTVQALDADTKHLFRLYSTPVDYVPSFVKWMVENIPERKVVLINPNDESGWDQNKLFTQVYGENGFEVLGAELFERGQSDFTPMLTKILAMQPDIIELSGTPPATAGLIVRQVRELGYKGRITKMGGAGPFDIVAAAGVEASEGIINLLYADQNNPAYRALADAYKASQGHDPNEIIVSFYDGASVLFDAIAAGGDASDVSKAAAAFATVLPKQSVQGETLTLGGMETYGANAQVMSVNYIGEIRNGQPVVIGKTE